MENLFRLKFFYRNCFLFWGQVLLGCIEWSGASSRVVFFCFSSIMEININIMTCFSLQVQVHFLLWNAKSTIVILLYLNFLCKINNENMFTSRININNSSALYTPPLTGNKCLINKYLSTVGRLINSWFNLHYIQNAQNNKTPTLSYHFDIFISAEDKCRLKISGCVVFFICVFKFLCQVFDDDGDYYKRV